MRSVLFPVAAVALLTAGPALAQQQQQGQQAQQGQQMQQAQPGGQEQPTREQVMRSQQQMEQTLREAGFQNIRVLDAAYLVQARTQQGETVVLVVNPGPTVAVLQQPGAAGLGEQGAVEGILPERTQPQTTQPGGMPPQPTE